MGCNVSSTEDGSATPACHILHESRLESKEADEEDGLIGTPPSVQPNAVCPPPNSPPPSFSEPANNHPWSPRHSMDAMDSDDDDVWRRESSAQQELAVVLPSGSTRILVVPQGDAPLDIHGSSRTTTQLEQVWQEFDGH